MPIVTGILPITNQYVMDEMCRHEERLVDADGDGKRQDPTERLDCERFAVMTRVQHVLIETTTVFNQSINQSILSTTWT